MKPDWDSLAADFKDNEKVIIADVDCTTDGKSLCEKYGVRGCESLTRLYAPPSASTRPAHAKKAHARAHSHLRDDLHFPVADPTIKYFNPPDEEGEDYKGGRDLASMKKFAETELGPGCSVDQMENCSDEQKKELKTYIDMPADKRAAKLEELKKALESAEKTHNELLEALQKQYKDSSVCRPGAPELRRTAPRTHTSHQPISSARRPIWRTPCALLSCRRAWRSSRRTRRPSSSC